MTILTGVNNLSKSDIEALRKFRANADTRLRSSESLATASKYFELNAKFFEENNDKIKTLVDSMAKVNAAIAKATQNDADIGTCKIVRKEKGFLRMKNVTKEESVEKVNAEIQDNLGQPAVVIALTTLGILEKPKDPIVTLPEYPSNKTLKKTAAVIVPTAALGIAGVIFRKELGTGIASVAQNLKNVFEWSASKIISEETFKKLCSVSETVKETVKDANDQDIVQDKLITDQNCAKAAVKFVQKYAETVGQFVADQKWKIAIGGIGTAAVIGGVAIYKAVQNRKNKQVQEVEQAQQAPVQATLADSKIAGQI